MHVCFSTDKKITNLLQDIVGDGLDLIWQEALFLAHARILRVARVRHQAAISFNLLALGEQFNNLRLRTVGKHREIAHVTSKHWWLWVSITPVTASRDIRGSVVDGPSQDYASTS